MNFIVDLHVHTCTTSSCGQVDPADAVTMYRKEGFDGIAITDHFYKGYFEELGDLSWREKIDLFLEGYRKAKEAATDGFKVFLGIEFRNFETDDDFLVLGLTETFLYEHPQPYLLTLDRAIDLFHSAGAIVIQAHPVRMRLAVLENGKVRKNFRTEYMVQFLKENPHSKRMNFIEANRRMEEGDLESFREPVFMRVCDLRCPERLDGIEFYNGNYNWMQDDLELEAIAEKYPHLIKIASSDFHEPGHCGRGGIALEKDAETAEDIIKQLKEEKFIRLKKQLR